MIKQQNGLSAIPVLVTLLALGIITGIGWHVYASRPQTARSSSASDSPTGTSTTQSQNIQQTQIDPYAGWKVFKSDKVTAQFKYPQSWSLESHTDTKLQNFENTLLITPKDSDGYSFTIGLLVGDPTSQNGMPYKVYGSKQVGSDYIIFFSSKFESIPSNFTISKYDVSPGEATSDFVENQYTKDSSIPVILMGQLSKRDELKTNTSSHDIDTYTSHQYWNEVVKVLESFTL